MPIIARRLRVKARVKTKTLKLFVSHPAVWLSLYGCGAILTTAAVASAFGGSAAGTVAGFLVLAGTGAYEALRSRRDSEHVQSRLDQLGRGQVQMTTSVERIGTDLDLLRDDLALTTRSLQQQARKLEENIGVRRVAQPLVKRAQDNLSRMAPRPAAASKPKNFADLQAMAAARMANMNTASPAQHADADTTAPAPKFSDPVIAELLHHAIQHDRVETFAQPIVRLPSRRLAYLELFARIRARAGIYLTAEQYRHLAEQETLISEVDHILLIHAMECIRADARRDTNTGYFLNISARTLRNVNFMTDLLTFLRNNRDLAPQLIFELQHKEFASLGAPYIAVMKGLAQVGCSFSIDNIQSPDLDMSRLRELNVRFVKIEAAQLIRMGDTHNGIDVVQRFKHNLLSAGAAMIVERIETERDLRELLDFEVDYGEGFLFGKPDLEIAYRPRKTA